MPQTPYRFNPPLVDGSNNRVNTSREPPANTKWRSSLRYANIVQPGQTIPVPVSGTQFYFRALSAPVQCRPSGGVFSEYAQGEGMNLSEENAFASLEIKNTNSLPVVFEIFAGFQGFIDNKLILQQSLQPQVAYPTYPVANAATSVAINDLSGSKFTDINGGQWYALYRIAIVISNTDGGTTLLLHEAAATGAADPSVCAIFPLTSIRLDISGNYKLVTGGGNINAIVSEIYSAIPATL